MDASDAPAPPLIDIAEREAPGTPLLPTLPASIPRRGSSVTCLIGRVGLRLFGWKVIGNFPDLPKGVIIVAPHTSNWDFIAGFWAYLALDLHCNWFGKHTIFAWPFGGLFRRFGGIPIHRESKSATQVVDLFAEEFAKRPQMYLAIAPEGTRKKVAEWKSGFYRIAMRANVPVIPVALDYRLSRVILGAPFTPTGAWERDIVRIKALFDGITARIPDQF
ncbi:MAG: 1-acyl-sn-glycerol-3-phosphate acyltransferase [Gemmatimonadetes bacterium]|jgi:1-acyl-sn-glycerol-3-phosphate acyltransferase|nr:1-acyl-sn-glycerol-3-phosphate acyltransferase [Gemmatimonadota bacterium]HNV74155.1 1-acyl-sn-glycerol-3-phosphate acyltransferase [Gemmatimonadaceae bacterium]MBK6841642.1 1-acyl-sn-glycerol-3-phosphate acyltransferase [Gemmatimonadota bacterium]MBK7835346.1 1-acyl-sn-glycerol-3-phosphate acyltransferase [Gemmatimonadota bacterium]MBK8061738.1 1-acyl-sn-glycerol-3-phosphate acyltransferase [Gemmatimonadota bacterium]